MYIKQEEVLYHRKNSKKEIQLEYVATPVVASSMISLSCAHYLQLISSTPLEILYNRSDQASLWVGFSVGSDCRAFDF